MDLHKIDVGEKDKKDRGWIIMLSRGGIRGVVT